MGWPPSIMVPITHSGVRPIVIGRIIFWYRRAPSPPSFCAACQPHSGRNEHSRWQKSPENVQQPIHDLTADRFRGDCDSNGYGSPDDAPSTSMTRSLPLRVRVSPSELPRIEVPVQGMWVQPKLASPCFEGSPAVDPPGTSPSSTSRYSKFGQQPDCSL